MIAYYLGTTPTYLLRGSIEEEDASEQEMNILKMYRKLSYEKKNCINDILRIFSEE